MPEKEWTDEQKRELAKARAEKLRDAEKRKKDIKKQKKYRDKNRGSEPRAKRPNGSVTDDEKRAQRNSRVAIHRARKAGKPEDEAQAAGRAAYLRAMARSSKEARDTMKKEGIGEQRDKPGERGPNKKTHPPCNARKAGQDGVEEEDVERCRLAAGYGTDHLGFGRCKYHGGLTPNGKKSAEREELALEIVEKEIQFYGAPLDIDPLDALAQEVRRTAGHVAWLADQVRQMQDGELFEDTVFGKRPDSLIQLYQNERDRLVSVSKAAAAAGVAQRSIQLAEEQGKLLAMVIRDVLWDKALGLTPQQRQLSGEVVRRHLIALDTTSRELPAGA